MEFTALVWYMDLNGNAVANKDTGELIVKMIIKSYISSFLYIHVCVVVSPALRRSDI